MLALVTRAQALSKLGRMREAIGDLRSAVQLARPQADPALFLRSVAALLELDGDDQLAAEAHALARLVTGDHDKVVRPIGIARHGGDDRPLHDRGVVGSSGLGH